MKVLVADDDRSTQRMVEIILQKEGYEPLLVSDGAQALELLTKEKPSLAIIDWLMPELDGLDLIREIRKDHSPEWYTYVIMLTAKDDKRDLVTAFDSGVDDFIKKPFHRNELLVRLKVGERIVNFYNKMRDLERMAVVGQMAASLKHEIFNPLTAVLGAVDLLKLRDDLDENLTRYVGIIETNVRRIEGIVRKVETLKKAQSVEVEDGVEMIEIKKLPKKTAKED